MKETIAQLEPKLREAEKSIERLKQKADLNEQKCSKNHIPEYDKENV